MSPSNIPWWAWLLAAVASYFIQLMMSPSTDKGSSGAWAVRIGFIVVMFFSAIVAVIRFVKWVWMG
jgi:hypothetical protein